MQASQNKEITVSFLVGEQPDKQAILSDIIRAVVLKIGFKHTIKLELILEASTINKVHLRATGTLLNESAYKLPAELPD